MIWVFLSVAYLICSGVTYGTLVNSLNWDNDDPGAWFGAIFWPVLLCVGLGFGLYKIPAVVKEHLENRRESKKLQVGEAVKVLNTTGIGAPEYRQLKQLCNKFEENLRVSERE